MLRRVLLTVLTGALLTACASDTDGGSSADVAPAADTHNEADMAFVTGMIPHHQQAIDMARLVDARTTRPELRTMADDIVRTQGEEISRMQGWLRAWGAQPGGMGHGAHGGDASGMMNEVQMDELTSFRGDEFDLAFVTMMRDHHEGAIQMAGTVLRDGQNADVKQLANQIIAAQRKEITQLTTWRDAWAS